VGKEKGKKQIIGIKKKKSMIIDKAKKSRKIAMKIRFNIIFRFIIKLKEHEI
jgi:hypothetical protein